MSSAQDRIKRDLAISRPAKAAKPKRDFARTARAIKLTATEIATTTLLVLFIVSTLVGGLSLFDLVEPGRQLDKLMGALLIAFSVVAFLHFIRKGVKHQLQNLSEGE